MKLTQKERNKKINKFIAYAFNLFLSIKQVIIIIYYNFITNKANISSRNFINYNLRHITKIYFHFLIYHLMIYRIEILYISSILQAS